MDKTCIIYGSSTGTCQAIAAKIAGRLGLASSDVYDVADIIGTYVYRMGLGKLEFSTGTAVGLFNSVISMILVLSSNFIARKATGKGIW